VSDLNDFEDWTSFVALTGFKLLRWYTKGRKREIEYGFVGEIHQ
jgi:hypothetical protein